MVVHAIQRIQAVAALAADLGGDDIDQGVMLKHADVGRVFDMTDQGFLHRRASGVGHMHNAARTVAAFAGQVQFARLLAKGHAHFYQPLNGGGCALNHGAGGGHIVQASACV